MYLDFGVKEIPISAIRAVGSADSAVYAICGAPTYNTTRQCVAYDIKTNACVQYQDIPIPSWNNVLCNEGNFDQNQNYTPDGGRCGGNRRPPHAPCNPNSTCYYEDVCSPLVDGTGICTSNYQIPDDYEDRMANRDCGIKYFQCDDGSYVAHDPAYCPDQNGTIIQDEEVDYALIENTTPIFSIDPRESLPVSEGGFVSDEEYSQFNQTTPIAIADLQEPRGRCIKLYKPCPEGYIDGNPNCPNTGDCIPDPNYVAYGGLIQMQPIEQTASTNFNIGTQIPIAQPIYRDSTPLPFERTSPTTAATTTSETSTPEEPKESGLGILVLGLIALEVLAT